jgi:hypothetical protein
LVYATIEPSQITLGESARYTITNLGSDAETIPLPTVPGLDFQVISRVRGFEFVNGTTILSTEIIARVTPQVAGIFSIPAVTPKAQPLVLQVNQQPAAAGSFGPKNSDPQAKAPIFSGGSLPSGVHLTEDGSAYLRVSVPKREVYVGESLPVDIELGLRSGFVSGLSVPKLNGDEFTQSGMSRQPERAEKIIGGEEFVVLTWHSVLAMIKPGTFSLTAESPLTVKIRTQSRHDSLLDDQFGDPFLRNFFGNTVSKEITATSPAYELTVLPLPSEGRPADFRGAVGEFKIASDISSTTAQAGDPITLRMRVSGAGNFDRVDSAMLEHLDQWKTYPAKSSFDPAEPTGYRGEKIFEQPLIASKPGKQTLPPLAFSYFDPATRRYETAHSAPIEVTIAPSLADTTGAAASAGNAGTAGSDNPSAAGLRPDHAAAGLQVRSLMPLYLQPRFLVIPSLLALALAGGWLGVRRRFGPARAGRAQELAAAQSAARLLAQMESAARARNAVLFFTAARKAVQQALAARWKVLPEQMTADEVQARLGADGDEVRRLFALADESRYSGHQLKTADFAQWTRVVRRYLFAREAA